MHAISLRAAALHALTVGAAFATPLATSLVAQAGPTAEQGSSPPTGQTDDQVGLPTFLLKVPGGKVQMGLSHDEFVAAVCQAVFPSAPDQAAKIAQEKLTDWMRRSSSMLGKGTVDVEPFLLGKWPVKNSEFQAVVEQDHANGGSMRPPAHWWRWGCPESFNEHLPKIGQQFPKDDLGWIYYFEQHGHELPWKVQDEKGKPIGDLPVTWVSWRAANQFAARLGMRLPTEAELTRAMRGDGTAIWPVGNAYSEQLLKDLQMASTRQYVLKPVGTVQAAIGPYGHLDLFGQVMQLCGDLGFQPISGREAFDREWKALQKHKVGKLVSSHPSWKDDKVIAKGGCYLSYQEPTLLMIDARAPIQTVDTLESVGFRLAKSLRPGYDFLYSLLRIGFARNALAKEQDVDLGTQIGAEFYELAANGFPTAYHAVSFAPLNWLTEDKKLDLGKLMDASQETPIAIGAVATTDALAGGVKAGIYTVLFRHAGVPRELTDAIKKGHKAVLAEMKAKEKAGDKDKDKDKDAEAKDDKDKKDERWRTTVRQFGLTDEDLAAKEAADGNLGYVRIDGVKIATDRAQVLLRDFEGKIVAAFAHTGKAPVQGAGGRSGLELIEGTREHKGKLTARITFSIPLCGQVARKAADFVLDFDLERAMPTAAQQWRLPK